MATTAKSPQRPSTSCDSSVTSHTDERMTERRKIEMKKEEKKRLEETSCTFQPTMSARRGRDNLVKPVTGSRFDHLYKDAVKRKTEGPKNNMASDESRNSFKPNISPRARSMSSDRKPSDLINSLHKGAGIARAPPKEPVRDENLFKPKINKRSSSVERTSSTDTSSRLYAFRNRQEENLQKKKVEAAAKEALECTFAPKLNRSRSSPRDSAGNPKPVIDRLLQYGADKKNKLEGEKKLKAEKDKLDETFQPVISRSKLSPSPKSENGSVYSRLALPIEKGKDFNALLASADADLTFQPTLHRSRSSSVRSRSGSITGENVHDRLFREGVQKKIDLEEEQRLAKMEEEKKYTFAPTIPLRASLTAEPSADTTLTTPVFDRLNTSKSYMQNILSQIKTELELNECTFQPTINHTLPAAARRSSEGPVHERLVNDANKIRKDVERRESIRLLNEVEGMTFHPSLPESSVGIVNVRRKSSLIYNDGDDMSVSTMTTGNVYERLSTAHTVSSLGGCYNDDQMSVLSSTHTIDREKANAVVDRLMAAGDKHKEDLKVWEEIKASEEVKGATFSPHINGKSAKIAMKIREEEYGSESEADLGPMSSTRRKSISKIPTASSTPTSGAVAASGERRPSLRGPLTPTPKVHSPTPSARPLSARSTPHKAPHPTPSNTDLTTATFLGDSAPSTPSSSIPVPPKSMDAFFPPSVPENMFERIESHTTSSEIDTPAQSAPKLNSKKSTATVVQDEVAASKLLKAVRQISI